MPPSSQNGGEVMVVDANHELFSRVGIIGQRTQVIQLVSLPQILFCKTTSH